MHSEAFISIQRLITGTRFVRSPMSSLTRHVPTLYCVLTNDYVWMSCRWMTATTTTFSVERSSSVTGSSTPLPPQKTRRLSQLPTQLTPFRPQLLHRIGWGVISTVRGRHVLLPGDLRLGICQAPLLQVSLETRTPTERASPTNVPTVPNTTHANPGSRSARRRARTSIRQARAVSESPHLMGCGTRSLQVGLVGTVNSPHTSETGMRTAREDRAMQSGSGTIGSAAHTDAMTTTSMVEGGWVLPHQRVVVIIIPMATHLDTSRGTTAPQLDGPVEARRRRQPLRIPRQCVITRGSRPGATVPGRPTPETVRCRRISSVDDPLLGL